MRKKKSFRILKHLIRQNEWKIQNGVDRLRKRTTKRTISMNFWDCESDQMEDHLPKSLHISSVSESRRSDTLWVDEKLSSIQLIRTTIWISDRLRTSWAWKYIVLLVIKIVDLTRLRRQLCVCRGLRFQTRMHCSRRGWTRRETIVTSSCEVCRKRLDGWKSVVPVAPHYCVVFCQDLHYGSLDCWMFLNHRCVHTHTHDVLRWCNQQKRNRDSRKPIKIDIWILMFPLRAPKSWNDKDAEIWSDASFTSVKRKRIKLESRRRSFASIHQLDLKSCHLKR